MRKFIIFRTLNGYFGLVVVSSFLMHQLTYCVNSANVDILVSGQVKKLQNKHIVGARKCGFFSEFLGVLGHILWCEQNSEKAVVFWDKKCLYYEPHGFNGTYNAWEYYFDPVSDAKYEPGDEIDSHYWAPNNFFVPWSDFTHMQTVRPILGRIIKNYIKVKPYILDIVNNFYAQNMQDSIVVGIHLRGTNKGEEAVARDPRIILNKAQEYGYLASVTGKKVKFLVASDEQALIDFAIKKLSKGDHKECVFTAPVITYPAKRSIRKGGTNYKDLVGTQQPEGFFASRGIDVLVEVLLLAKCSCFVSTRSNVSTAVICFNPALEHFQFDCFAKLKDTYAKKKI